MAFETTHLLGIRKRATFKLAQWFDSCYAHASTTAQLYYSLKPKYREYADDVLLKLMDDMPSFGNAREIFRTIMTGNTVVRNYYDTFGKGTLLAMIVMNLHNSEQAPKEAFKMSTEMAQIATGVKLLDVWFDDPRNHSRLNELGEISDAFLWEYIVSSDDRDAAIKTICQKLTEGKMTPKVVYLFKKVRELELDRKKTSSNWQKAVHSYLIGFYLGQVCYEVMKREYPDMGDWMLEGFCSGGGCSNLFDDSYDFLIDRKTGEGYSLWFYPVLQLLIAAKLLQAIVLNWFNMQWDEELAAVRRKLMPRFFAMAILFHHHLGKEVLGLGGEPC
jgi:hypothetical protein